MHSEAARRARYRDMPSDKGRRTSRLRNSIFLSESRICGYQKVVDDDLHINKPIKLQMATNRLERFELPKAPKRQITGSDLVHHHWLAPGFNNEALRSLREPVGAI